MARYPELPQYQSYSDRELMEMYKLLQDFTSTLILELDTRDVTINQKTAERVYTAVTTSDIGNPQGGAIAYSKKSDTFRGYTVASGWVDLH